MDRSDVGAAFALAIGIALAACNDAPVRDNPFDEGGIAWGTADPGLEVRYADGAPIILTWTRLDAVEVVSYRLFRRDVAAAGDWGLIGEVAQADGASFEHVDDTRLVGAPELAYRITVATPFGESAALDETGFSSDVDLDGDGVVAGDCDAGDGAVSPATDERCDGVDQDCDGDTDEGDACGPGLLPDGEPCDEDRDCKNGLCGAAGLCGAWHTPCVEGACPGDLLCADGFDVCTSACGAAPCQGDMACIDGWCLPGCGADAACAEGEHCLVPPLQPIAGGGCGTAPECDACGAGQLCVAAPDAAFACCTDGDGDGRFGLACAYGSDCDDNDPNVSAGCGTCGTSDDCGGAQCVLLATGEGLCGGPAGCHCPDGTGCAVGESPPRCVMSDGCLDVSDCEIAALGRWQCREVPTLGAGRRCVCDDPIACPECVLDAECPVGGVCETGRCVLP